MEAWSLQPAYSYCQWSFMSRRKDFDSLRRAASRFLYCSTMKSQGRFCILCHFYCLCTLRLLVLFPQLELVLPSSSTLALPVSLNRCTPSFTRLHCSFLLKFSGIRDHGHTSWDSSLCEVTGIWSRKASLGNPSTAREQRGSATSHCTDLTPGQCSALFAVSRRLGLVLCAFACTRRFWKAEVLILVRCSLPPTEGDELHPFRCPTKPVQAESVGFLVRGAALCPEPFTSAVYKGRGNWLQQDSRGRPRSAAALPVPFTPPGGHSAHLLGQPGGLAQARSAARVPSAPSPHSPPRAALLGRAPRFSVKGRAAICPLDTHLRGPDVVVQVRQLQHPAEGRRHHRRAAVKRGSRREGRGCDTVVKARCHTAVK